jgi:hypothetical protein
VVSQKQRKRLPPRLLKILRANVATKADTVTTVTAVDVVVVKAGIVRTIGAHLMALVRVKTHTKIPEQATRGNVATKAAAVVVAVIAEAAAAEGIAVAIIALKAAVVLLRLNTCQSPRG